MQVSSLISENAAKGSMKDTFGNAIQFLLDYLIDTLEFLIHIPGCAIFGNFQINAIFFGYPHRIGSDGGKVDILVFHRLFLAF